MAARRLPAHKRRRQILLAAIEVFAQHGFQGATTREIAAEADVAEALLYRYFEGKEALFIEGMRLTAAHLVEGIEATIADHRDAPDVAIGAILMDFKKIIDGQQAFSKMVFMITAELDNPNIRNAYIPFQESALHAIEAAISDWKIDGLLTKELPARATAWLILGCFQTIALMKQTERIDELHIQPVLDLVGTFITRTQSASTT